MNTPSKLIMALGALLLTAAAQVQAFGGGIAIGMSQLDGEETLDVSFSARATLETDEYNFEEKMYYRPGKLREEMAVAGQDMITIQRHDLGKLWMIMPQGMYMESDIDKPSEQMKSFELISHEQVGTEVVNGMDTTKYKTVWQTDDGKFGGFSWVTEDGIAVKAFLVSETDGEKHRIRYQITELERGSQPQDLFEVPEGYAKMDLSGGRGLAGMMGGMGARSQPEQQQGADQAESQSAMDAAQEAAAEGAKETTREHIGDKVREGIRGLFRRD